MRKGHFRLTCVAQKRCCLSSLISLLLQHKQWTILLPHLNSVCLLGFGKTIWCPLFKRRFYPFLYIGSCHLQIWIFCFSAKKTLFQCGVHFSFSIFCFLPNQNTDQKPLWRYFYAALFVFQYFTTWNVSILELWPLWQVKGWNQLMTLAICESLPHPPRITICS